MMSLYTLLVEVFHVKRLVWLGFLYLVLFCDGVSPNSVWNLFRTVQGYKSYSDVSPIRYDTEVGLEFLNFSFTGTKSEDRCAEEDIYIVIRQGSLPFVEGSDQSFPPDFLVLQEPTFRLAIRTGQQATFSMPQPPPGPWYVVGYTLATETAIQQKGLTSDDPCYYYLVSTMSTSDVTVSTPILLGEDVEATIDRTGSVFSFMVPPSTISFEVQVLGCDPTPCNWSLEYLSFNMGNTDTEVQNCTGTDRDEVGGHCSLIVTSPLLSDLQLVKISPMDDDDGPVSMRGDSSNQTVTFRVVSSECSSQTTKSRITQQCQYWPNLGRIQFPVPMVTVFALDSGSSLSVDVMAASVIAVPFHIDDPNDVGGTLKLTLSFSGFLHANSSNVQVCGAFMYDRLPGITPDFDLCTAGYPGGFNLTSTDSDRDGQVSRYVPYPQAGLWHIVLQAYCFDSDSNTSVSCDEGRKLVDIFLELHPCVDGGCGGKGSCVMETSGSDLVSYWTCNCDADYSGYGCTDSTNAQSVSTQLAAAYLLTFSNFFFLPAIVVGFYRGFWLEAFVYCFTMFFSTFYHACDGTRLEVYRLCITEYNVLQLSDFFGSACSLWFTVVAMAHIRFKQLEHLLQIAGVFGLFIGVIYDLTSLWVIAVPILAGLTTISLSWGYRMYRTRRLYPSLRRYIFFLLPGITLAVVGGAAFAFLETESNYKYVHSLWHACVAISIVLLLPPRPVEDSTGKITDPSDGAIEMSRITPLSPP